ncbi:MAG TPA: 4-(cytidine 5'-diphospho)-2-C-methyl-D-erythritol kinase [Ilumatobacteraceae bacterium]
MAGGIHVTTSVVVIAPAKLTLSLHITGVRDDGYHFLDAEMVTLDWHDTLTIDPSSTGLSADGRFAKRMPLDDSNLVAKALRHAGRTAAVHIHKELPSGGGLGGGSADAAAVLRWAGCDDVSGAIALGSDVPFCVVGGRARVRGVGEIVERLPFEAMDVTLIVPPLKVSTPFVYRMWDDAGGPRSETSNDLEQIAVKAFSALARWRDRIREATGSAPSLAGSGATWFVRGHHDLEPALPEALIVRTSTCR